MNQFALNKLTKNYDPACGDLLTMAERELTSFFTAVKALFGSEQAEAAAKDWLHELMAVNDLPASTRQMATIHGEDHGATCESCERSIRGTGHILTHKKEDDYAGQTHRPGHRG